MQRSDPSHPPSHPQITLSRFIHAGITRDELVASEERFGRRQYDRWEEGAGRLVKRAPPDPSEPPLRWKPTHEADFVVRTGGWTRVGIDKEPGAQPTASPGVGVVSPPWGTFHFVPGTDPGGLGWERPDLPQDHLARSMMALQRAATAGAVLRTVPSAELPTKSQRRCAASPLETEPQRPERPHGRTDASFEWVFVSSQPRALTPPSARPQRLPEHFERENVRWRAHAPHRVPEQDGIALPCEPRQRREPHGPAAVGGVRAAADVGRASIAGPPAANVGAKSQAAGPPTS